MRAALLAVLACFVAQAEPPKRTALVIESGAFVGADGGTFQAAPRSCYLDEATCVLTAQDIVRLKAENASLVENAGVPLPAVALVVVLAIGAGFAVGRMAR